MAPNVRPSRMRATNPWPAGLILLTLAAGWMALPLAAADKVPPPPPEEGTKPAPKAPPSERVVRPAKDPELDKDAAELETVEDGREVLGATLNPGEARAYRYVLLHARDVAPEKLHEKAREDLTFAHLWERPAKYRGDIIHIHGQMRMLKPYEVDDKLLLNEGIKTIYEAWIFPSDDKNTSNFPYCVLFTELPDGVKLTPKENYKVDYQVNCDAYFFKKYRYPGEDRKPRNAPMFIGRTFTFQVLPKDSGSGGWAGLVQYLIVGGLVLVGVLVTLIVGLTWWFRRNDLLTQRRLALAREAPFVAPPPENGTAIQSEERARSEMPPLE